MKHRILWSFVVAIVLVLTFTMVVSAQETNDPLDEVFEFKGYSFSPFGEDACLGFYVNYEAKSAYEAKIGRTVNIGVVFASYDDLNGKAPLDKNSSARAGVIAVDIIASAIPKAPSGISILGEEYEIPKGKGNFIPYLIPLQKDLEHR